MHEGLFVSLSQAYAHGLIQLIIFQRTIQSFEHKVGLMWPLLAYEQ